MKRRLAQLRRFEGMVLFDTHGRCWLWTGSHAAHGYGAFGLEGRQELAHRAAWRLYRGPIPEGLHVHHRCGRRGCVNPAHLELLTPNAHAQRHVRRNPESVGYDRPGPDRPW